MPRFRYEARTPDNRQVAEEFDADSAVAAITAIEERGWVVLSMVRILEEERAEGRGQQAEGGDRTLAQVVEAALPKLTPLIQPLCAYADELPSSQRTELLNVTELLAKANPAAIERDITVRPTWWLPLLSAADEPTITAQLARFATESRANTISKDRWWWALAYPLVILLISLGVLLVLSWIVIPEFKIIFEDFGMQLPGMTQVTMWVGEFLRSPWALLIPAGLVGVVLTARLAKPRVRRSGIYYGIVSEFPLLYGATVSRGRCAQYLGQLIHAGLTPARALPVAAAATNRTRLVAAADAFAMKNYADRVSRGDARALGVATTFALGEAIPDSSRARVLEEIGKCFLDRKSQVIWNRSGWLGPAATFFVGFVVLWVVVSLFLPLVKLIEWLS
jgi:type IV pilus assembly protein PilC